MCKIFILQNNWYKKRAQFFACKISSARYLHILQEMCKMVQDFFAWVYNMYEQHQHNHLLFRVFLVRLAVQTVLSIALRISAV